MKPDEPGGRSFPQGKTPTTKS